MGWFGFGPGIPYLGWGSGNTMGNSYWEGPVYGQHLPDVNRTAEDNRKDSKTFLKYLLFATVTILALATGKGVLSSLFHRGSSSSKEAFKDTLSLKGKSTANALHRLNKGLDQQYFNDVQKHLQKYERTGDYTDLQKHLFENVPNGQRGLLSRSNTLEDSLPPGYTIETLLSEPNLSVEGVKYRDLRRAFKDHERELIEQFKQDRDDGLLPNNIDNVKKYAKYRSTTIGKFPERIQAQFKKTVNDSKHADFLNWAYTDSPEYQSGVKRSTLDDIKKIKTKETLESHQAALLADHKIWQEKHEKLAAMTKDELDELKEAHGELGLSNKYIEKIKRDRPSPEYVHFDENNPQYDRLQNFHKIAAKMHQDSQQEIEAMFKKLSEQGLPNEMSGIAQFHSNAQAILSR